MRSLNNRGYPTNFSESLQGVNPLRLARVSLITGGQGCPRRIVAAQGPIYEGRSRIQRWFLKLTCETNEPTKWGRAALLADSKPAGDLPCRQCLEPKVVEWSG